MSTSNTTIVSEGLAPGGPYDLLLKGGHIIDPANGVSARRDLAMVDGRIAALAEDLPASAAERVVDVSGLYVTPGLIDMHVHCFPGHDHYGVSADAHSFRSGVTTMVDAGSSGPLHFDAFVRDVVHASRTRVLAYVNVVDLGMGGDFEQEVSRMQPELAAQTVDAHPDVAVGIKVAHFWVSRPWDAEHQPWDNVDRGVQAGELCSKPVMVDFWPRPPERSYEELILSRMRPGDIHTHIYGQHIPVLDGAGCLNPTVLQARERGVIFDLGHGAGSFWFRNAVRAVELGFGPDSISTDLHNHSMNGPAFNMLNAMSKMLNIGLSLDEVIMRSTVTPAREIGHPELGTLSVGSEADVAVLRLEEGSFGFVDCGRARMQGDRVLECALTLRAGQVVYDPEGLTMPDWQSAPGDYWVCHTPES